MYFDAVLVSDSGEVVFNSTPENTKRWIEETEWVQTEEYTVCDGRTLQFMTVEEYINKS